jgi:uncharacterized cupredoxin-like copper-binding protein
LHLRRFAIVLPACGASVATALAGFSFAGIQSPQRTAVVTSITVHVTEYRFKLSASSAPVGTVVFTVVNDGRAPHNFSIAGETTRDLAPGTSAKLSVKFTSAGAQPYLCTLPGHAEAGMQGTFTIKGAQRSGRPTSVLNATETEWKISLSTSTGAKVKSVRHGLIRFKVRNVGVLGHNFVIARHQTILITHGNRAVLDVTLKRGRYTYICSIAGHAAKGMKGSLIVT